MKYQSRGLTFTIEELEEKERKSFEVKYLAMQDLTEEQKNNPNYLREVYGGDTIKEIKNKIDGFEGYNN